MILAAVFAIILGFIVLSWAADRLVFGASSLAAHYGVSTLLIGLTIVAIGTSAPEIVVSAMAALSGKPSIAMGNAIGSNITNIALVMGMTALVMPIEVKASVVKKELPILFLITLGVLATFIDHHFGRIDGIILVIGLFVFLTWLIVSNIRSHAEQNVAALDLPRDIAHVPVKRAAFWLLIGLVLLPLSSRILVWGAVEIAQAFGVSDLVIGLTIIAIGTSLPELATSVAGALKGKADLAIGNIVGSNIFNLLAVLPLPGLIRPSSIDPMVLVRDYPIMLLLTTALCLMALTGHAKRNHKHAIDKIEGSVLLTFFVGYIVLLSVQNQ